MSRRRPGEEHGHGLGDARDPLPGHGHGEGGLALAGNLSRSG
ncbi:hypothetical protein [Dokdonella immobilis]|nr:hypothetical protein [Dokdonella immobilis]